MLDVVIAERELQGDGILVLKLVAADGRALPAHEAGAHVDVEIQAGLVRQYSLCGDPADREQYRLGILRDPNSRGGSVAIHDLFHAGRHVRISAPRNHFPLFPGAGPAVLVGGGIGITPLLAMAHALHRAGRPFALHYCLRERARGGFLAELAQAPFADRVAVHLDDGEAAQRFDPRRDLPPAAENAHVYICGPAGFIDWIQKSCAQAGYPPDAVHREFFTAEVDVRGQAFEVVLARSGRTVPVPAESSIVAALARAGVAITVSCEQGVCGTCLCTVLEGEPDHRDVYLTDEEKAANDQMALCCSRSKSPRIVLDL